MTQSSYAHRVRQIGFDHYRLSWIVDFHYSSSRLRHPRIFTRDTDEAGAVKFSKRWGLGLRRTDGETGESK